MEELLKQQIKQYLQIEKDYIVEEGWEQDSPCVMVHEDIKAWLFDKAAQQIEENLVPYFHENFRGIVKKFPLEINDEEYLYGFKFEIRGQEFLCALGYDEEIGHPHVGITFRDCTHHKIELINHFTRYNFQGDEFRSNHSWYAYRYVDYDYFYEGFQELLNEVLESLP